MYAHGASDPGECILGESSSQLLLRLCLRLSFYCGLLVSKTRGSRYEYQVVPKGSPEYDDPWGPTHPEGQLLSLHDRQ